MASSEVDLSFCDTCVYRGKIIDEADGGTYCFMTGVDYMTRALAEYDGDYVPVFGEHSDEIVRIVSASELAISAGAEMLADVARCIGVVSTGGQPLLE